MADLVRRWTSRGMQFISPIQQARQKSPAEIMKFLRHDGYPRQHVLLVEGCDSG